MFKTKKVLHALLTLALIIPIIFGGGYRSVSAQPLDGLQIESVSAMNTGTDIQAGLSGSGAVSVTASSDAGISFEVQVPWQQLSVQEVLVGDKTYTSVSLADWLASETPGKPSLPLLTQQIGTPVGVSVEVKVTPGKAHIQKINAPVLPTATQIADLSGGLTSDPDQADPQPLVLVQEDPVIYQAGITFPSVLAVISNDGYLRQQRVVAVNVFPCSTCRRPPRSRFTKPCAWI